ncbi:MAG TPA: UDP-3-O-(3-hydroxymyristoyl)glucosamine N-acyltransferase [Candidatus Eisenbacteria bacterium]
MPSFLTSAIAKAIGGQLDGTVDPLITGVAGIREAGPGEIAFLAHPRYASYVSSTRAHALIVGHDHERGQGEGPVLIRVTDPYVGFLQTLHLFGGQRPRPAAGIHPTAVVDAGASMGAGASIGPNVVVESGATLGERVTLMAGVYVGADCRLGDDVTVYPNVVLRDAITIGNRVIIHPGAVIGADGFGYVKAGGVQLKVPQLGTVRVDDDVEIGANATIDRATTGVTHIGAGVKIDNLVQIAHNVTIGPHSIVCAQVGVSGSTHIGGDVTLGGQAGVGGHLKIGDRSMIGGQAGVTKSVPDDARVSGYPASDHEQALRVQAHTRRLPELVREIRALTARLGELERELEKERERVL